MAKSIGSYTRYLFLFVWYLKEHFLFVAITQQQNKVHIHTPANIFVDLLQGRGGGGHSGAEDQMLCNE